MANSKFVHIEESKKKNNKKPAIEYNNKTELSYKEQGLEVPENLSQQEKNFLSKVDPKVEPIVRTVSKIVRFKAIDYSSPKRERKEYLIYYENWTGRDWLKRIVPPVTDHIEGRYDEVITEPVYQQQELVGYKYSGKRQIHYIPFSKNKVDYIIENSVGSNKETIKFLFTGGPLGYEFPYDKFVNLSYDELANLLVLPGGPRLALQKEKLEEWEKQQQEQLKKKQLQQQQTQRQNQENKQ